MKKEMREEMNFHVHYTSREVGIEIPWVYLYMYVVPKAAMWSLLIIVCMGCDNFPWVFSNIQ